MRVLQSVLADQHCAGSEPVGAQYTGYDDDGQAQVSVLQL